MSTDPGWRPSWQHPPHQRTVLPPASHRCARLAQQSSHIMLTRSLAPGCRPFLQQRPHQRGWPTKPRDACVQPQSSHHRILLASRLTLACRHGTTQPPQIFAGRLLATRCLLYMSWVWLATQMRWIYHGSITSVQHVCCSTTPWHFRPPQTSVRARHTYAAPAGDPAVARFGVLQCAGEALARGGCQPKGRNFPGS